jgi:predicted HTH transcriptional regulator
MLFFVGGACFLLAIVFIIFTAVTKPDEYYNEYGGYSENEDLDCRIVRYVELHDNVTIDQISHAFKLPKEEARKRLDNLMGQGYIHRL